MPRKSFKAGGFGLTLEVPEAVVTTARKFFRRKRGQVHGGLYVSPTVPRLNVSRRDPAKTVEAFRKHNPDTEGTLRSSSEKDLQTRINEIEWYHTIELSPGVVTPGAYDHRPLVSGYGLPSDLRGKRVLDVATFDGFWAFEFEKRGAEVVAVDLPRLSQCDFPPPVRAAMIAQGRDQEMGLGFALAHEALNSKVKRVPMSLYDMDPASLGTFDLVHIADVLLHLERPLDALRAIRSVTGGEALVVDSFDPTIQDSSGRKLTQYLGGWWDVTWWLPSLDTLAQMVLDAGFGEVRVHSTYNIAQVNATEGYWRAVLKAKP